MGSGLSLIRTRCGPALWKQPFLQGIETECDHTDLELLCQIWGHWIVEVVSLVYFKRSLMAQTGL